MGSVAFTAATMQWLAVRVAVARREYKVKYPAMYAEGSSPEANTFNCIQRGHQNALEYLPSVMALQMLMGLQYPVVAAALGAIWAVGRVSSPVLLIVLFLVLSYLGGHGWQSAGIAPLPSAASCAFQFGALPRAEVLSWYAPVQIIYARGYSTGDPSKRAPGSALAGIVYLVLIIGCGYAGFQTVVG